MAGTNAYANMVRKRGEAPKGKRRKLDDYETPDIDTERLTRFVKFSGPILEPACGSGRMVRCLRRETGLKVLGLDIKKGFDFTTRKAPWHGDIITNPPYRDGLADAFVEQALNLAEGRVAMLMELKFLAGSKRAAKLYNSNKPEAIIIIPGRIYFFAGGKPIPSQFFSHCWIVWPKLVRRGPEVETKVFWAEDEFE